jgi:type IV secretion system protein VirB10
MNPPPLPLGTLPGDLDPSLDPHASKISPDDPRLRLPRARSRTLRTGPILAVVATLLGASTVAVAVALQPTPANRLPKPDGDPSGHPQLPLIPDAIRNAPPNGGPPRSRANDRARSDDAPSVPSERRPSSHERLESVVAEQDQRALGASILFDVHGPTDRSPPTAPPAADESRGTPAPMTSNATGAATDDPNLQERKNRFLDSEGALATTDSLAATIEHPRSPYEIQAGTIVPAVLLTAMNSDLPGPVVAQVRENVYDTVTGNYLLIPQGARLLANYDSMVMWGQERVLVCWNRLLFPNGDSIDLHCMPAADLEGRAGLTDQVDEHWTRLITGAAVSSLLAATAQGVAGSTTGVSPTVPQLWANGGAQAVNQTGQQIVRRDLVVQPTITVRPGFSVNVIVNKDMVVPPYPDTARAPSEPAEAVPSGWRTAADLPSP